MKYITLMMLIAGLASAQSITEQAQAVDRLARVNEGVYNTDYTFGVVSRPSQEEAKAMTPEQRREATIWGITHWNEAKLGPQPSMETVKANALAYVKVPQRVTPRQLRLALIDTGILPEQVTAAIEGIEDATVKAKALTEWNHATYYDRSNPTVSAIGSLLGLSSAQVDQLFVAAVGK